MPETPRRDVSVSPAYTPEESPTSWSPKAGRARKLIPPPRRITYVLAGFIALLLVRCVFDTVKGNGLHRPAYLTERISYNASVLPHAAFQPPEMLLHRASDMVDTFETYKYRPTCNISSLNLHAPFAPLCPDRTSMLEAMSSGGRIGRDAPYMPRGCDMRWFSTEEVCEIFSRFERVIIFGDSMMRHVIGSINVLLREDLGYGAVTDWNFSPEERRDCFCNYQFNVKACSIQGIFKTADVVLNDPDSLACPLGTIDVAIEQMIRFPIAQDELSRLRALLPPTKPKKPFAFIFGHGLWNDLDLQATLDWLDLILETSLSAAPWLSPTSTSTKQRLIENITGSKARRSSSNHRAHYPSPESKTSIHWPRLFVTPNASGREKPDEWLVSQGNKALQIFEEAVKEQVGRRGVEHVGTWNMSIQSNKFDGVHMDLKGNLVKAIMVINWLNMLEVEEF